MNDIKRVIYKIKFKNRIRTILKQTIQKTKEIKRVCDIFMFYDGLTIYITDGEQLPIHNAIFHKWNKWMIEHV